LKKEKTMQKITAFDKESVGFLSAMLMSMLKAAAREFGVTVKNEGGRYSPSSYTLRITFKILDPITGMPADFPMKAAKIGIPKDCWGKTFFGAGPLSEEYRIVDVKTRNRKYPVIAETLESPAKRYKFTARLVRERLLKNY